jgi:hypothetical protein
VALDGADSVRTTSVSDLSDPTLPAKTTYGMPRAGPSTGSHSETMPGSIGPRTIARRIESPWTATSEEVIPPLAMTKRGGEDSRIRRTTSTTAAETLREIARLSSPLAAVTSVRLVWITTSPRARPSTACATILSRWSARVASLMTASTSMTSVEA